MSRHLYAKCGTLEEGEAIPPLLIRTSKPSARLGSQGEAITVLRKKPVRMSMEDRVTTGEEEYEMTVAAIDEEPSKASCDTGEDAALTVVQNEYNHCFERSAKLDNKVHILLTVCAFLFVMLSESVRKLPELMISTTQYQLLIRGGYIALLTLTVTAFIILFVKLMKLLRGTELMRFDSYEILHRDMVNADKKQTIRYVCMMYEKCRDYNNQLIELKYKQFDKCTKLMVMTVILLLISALF